MRGRSLEAEQALVINRNEAVLQRLTQDGVEVPQRASEIEMYLQRPSYERLPLCFALLKGRYAQQLQDGLEVPLGYTDQIIAKLRLDERAGEHSGEVIDVIAIEDTVENLDYRVERVTSEQLRAHGALRLRHPQGLIYDLANPAFQRAISVMDETLQYLTPR